MGLISRVSSRTYRFKNSPKMSDTQENWAEEAPAVEDFPLEEMAMEEEANEPKMFGKWDLTEVKCMDMALADYIKFDKSNGRYLAHNSTRVNKTRFKKAQMHIVERLVNALMQKGRNNGKKMLSMRIVKHTFEIIHVMTGEKPSSNLCLCYHERWPTRRLYSNRSSWFRTTTSLRRFSNATSQPSHLVDHNRRQERCLQEHQNHR